MNASRVCRWGGLGLQPATTGEADRLAHSARPAWGTPGRRIALGKVFNESIHGFAQGTEMQYDMNWLCDVIDLGIDPS
jgi:hypothetical protein